MPCMCMWPNGHTEEGHKARAHGEDDPLESTPKEFTCCKDKLHETPDILDVLDEYEASFLRDE